jgi:fucose permease
MMGTRNRYIVCLVLFTFFVISLLTNVLGPIVPDIIRSFHVILSAAGLLIFSFFLHRVWGDVDSGGISSGAVHGKAGNDFCA